MSPPGTSEEDETPAWKLGADADATKGPRAVYMFSIYVAGAVDLIHSRQLSRPSVHKVYMCVQVAVGSCMRTLGH